MSAVDDLPPVRAVGPAPGTPPLGLVRLDHYARTLRRRRLVTEAGQGVLVDLPRTTTLGAGDALLLEAGGWIAVEAAPEALLEARAPDLARIAWHVGNRHAPCELGDGWLRVSFDRPMEVMLRGLGAEVLSVTAPFHPEGGAYAGAQDHGGGGQHEHGDVPHDH